MKYLMPKKINQPKEDVSGYSLEDGPFMVRECPGCSSTCGTGCSGCEYSCNGSCDKYCHGQNQDV